MSLTFTCYGNCQRQIELTQYHSLLTSDKDTLMEEVVQYGALLSILLLELARDSYNKTAKELSRGHQVL